MADTPSDPGARRRPRFLLPLLAILVGFGAPLLLAEVVLRFLPRNNLPPLLAVNDANPLLRFAPGRTFTYTRGWDFSLVTHGRTNNLGFVNDQDYDSTARSPLLAVVGDSYVESLMVPYPETMHGRLAARAGGRGRVYSFGVSGAPLSHYLVEADYARVNFHPAAFVVTIVGNDFDQSILQPDLRPGLWYFARQGDSLSLQRTDYRPPWWRAILTRSAVIQYALANLRLDWLLHQLTDRARGGRAGPVRKIGYTDASTDSARVAGSRLAVDQFLRELPARAGVAPAGILLVVDGARPSLYSEEGLREAAGSFFEVMRAYLLQAAERRGIPTLDLEPVFAERYREEGRHFEFALDGHWDGHGHKVAAEAVARSPLFTSLFGGDRR